MSFSIVWKLQSATYYEAAAENVAVVKAGEMFYFVGDFVFFDLQCLPVLDILRNILDVKF